MTKFEDLQAVHERLMEQSKAPVDAGAFVEEVQRAIHQMGVAAEDIAAPRERDQLRAILRFWASYVYEHTGTYPDTTLHPAVQPSRSSSAPEAHPPEPSRSRVPLFWIALAAGAVLIVLLGLVSVIVTAGASPHTTGKPPDASVNVEVTTERPVAPTLEIQWSILTAGPSPFDPRVWAIKLQLSATGGNSSYIFWVNGAHLPDVSNNQFTVEGKDCDPEKPIVGVTSGGQATSLELIIRSPLPDCPQP